MSDDGLRDLEAEAFEPIEEVIARAEAVAVAEFSGASKQALNAIGRGLPAWHVDPQHWGDIP